MREALRDWVAQGEAEVEVEGEGDAGGDFDAEVQLLLVPERVPEADALRDGVAVAQGDVVREAQEEADAQGEGEGEGEAL